MVSVDVKHHVYLSHRPLFEDLLPCQVVSAQHAAKDADRDLKQVDVTRHSKRQFVRHPSFCFLVL